jgi:serine/threonine protein kinase
MVETDRHIGIIMEYASGGELFDHILNNRYLKDNAARRLFAQLVSGVGYLHKKGIVHRDLKLENLLLDRNRNIIITDFGFANTFDPMDELGDEIEYNLTNKEFVKRMRLDRPNAKGLRRGDLMQTSCGSPCYAAPKLLLGVLASTAILWIATETGKGYAESTKKECSWSVQITLLLGDTQRHHLMLYRCLKEHWPMCCQCQ